MALVIILLLIAALVASVLPLTVGVVAFRRTGGRDVAVICGIFIGAAAAWAFTIVYWGLARLVLHIIDPAADAHHGTEEQTTVADMIWFQIKLGIAVTLFLAFIAQILVLSAFGAWRQVDPDSFHRVVRHVPRENGGDC